MDLEHYYEGVPDARKDEVLELIRDNKQDFVVWNDYYDEERSEASDEFFWNYKTDNTYVATSSDDVVGIGCYEPRCNRDDIHFEMDTFCYISLIIVDREYRGRGYGKTIFRNMVDSCKNEAPILFCTWESNTDMLHMAESFGFSLASVRLNHRYNGESSLYFVKI